MKNKSFSRRSTARTSCAFSLALLCYMTWKRRQAAAARRTATAVVISSDDGNEAPIMQRAWCDCGGYTVTFDDMRLRMLPPAARLNDSVINAFLWALAERYNTRWLAGSTTQVVALSTFVFSQIVSLPLVRPRRSDERVVPSADAITDVARLTVDLQHRARCVKYVKAAPPSSITCATHSGAWEWSYANHIQQALTRMLSPLLRRQVGRNDDAALLTIVLLPIHLVAVDHWVLAVIRLEARQWIDMTIYDSLQLVGDRDARDIARHIHAALLLCGAVKESQVSLPTVAVEVRCLFRQINESDCGLYSLIHATLALRTLCRRDVKRTVLPSWYPPTSADALLRFRHRTMIQLMRWGSLAAAAAAAG